MADKLRCKTCGIVWTFHHLRPPQRPKARGTLCGRCGNPVVGATTHLTRDARLDGTPEVDRGAGVTFIRPALGATRDELAELRPPGPGAPAGSYRERIAETLARLGRTDLDPRLVEAWVRDGVAGGTLDHLGAPELRREVLAVIRDRLLDDRELSEALADTYGLGRGDR